MLYVLLFVQMWLCISDGGRQDGNNLFSSGCRIRNFCLSHLSRHHLSICVRLLVLLSPSSSQNTIHVYCLDWLGFSDGWIVHEILCKITHMALNTPPSRIHMEVDHKLVSSKNCWVYQFNLYCIPANFCQWRTKNDNLCLVLRQRETFLQNILQALNSCCVLHPTHINRELPLSIIDKHKEPT